MGTVPLKGLVACSTSVGELIVAPWFVSGSAASALGTSHVGVHPLPVPLSWQSQAASVNAPPGPLRLWAAGVPLLPQQVLVRNLC